MAEKREVEQSEIPSNGGTKESTEDFLARAKRGEYHVHPRSGFEIFGERLKSGDVIESTDVYNSTNGLWELAPCPGLTLQEGNGDVVWVRPLHKNSRS